jgi:preprotein translocase subunit SecD
VPARLAWAAGLASLFLSGAAVAEPLTLSVTQAVAAFDQRNGTPLISFTMTKASAAAFADFTRRNVGRKAELRVDGKVFGAPVIREPITGGSGQLQVPSGQDPATVAARLSAGTARLEVEVVGD